MTRGGQTACNICGGSAFAPGPGARLTPLGGLPKCTRCGSLERHRALHRIFAAIPPVLTEPFHAYQVSPDFSVVRSRFRGLASVGAPPISPPAATRGKYGWTFAFHADVPDLRGTFRELFGLLEPAGILGVAVMGASFRRVTSEHADPKTRTTTWRYGADFGDKLKEMLGPVFVLEVVGADPCTSILDVAFFASRQERRLLALADSFARENLFPRLRRP
jgi:hypothetical protein